MFFKQLPSRLHHILFHTHTVSGIVISFALFIIFYAGAFALFKEEVFQWQEPAARHITTSEYNFDKSIEVLKKEYPDIVWTNRLFFAAPSSAIPFIQFVGSYKKKEEKQKRIWVYINPENYQVIKKRTTLSETIYDLHFFDQIPVLGRYLAGFVSIFFLFATLTGVLIHWKNTVRKFYDFSIRESAKQIWKNAHTVLGLLGVPFYIMYAVTGSVLTLSLLLLLPSGLVMYDGDTDKLLKGLRPQLSIQVDTQNVDSTSIGSIQECYQKFQKSIGNQELHYLIVKDYGKKDATVFFNVDDHKTLTGDGSILYSLQTGEELLNLLPENKKYQHQVLPAINKLHYATYGGFGLKIIYFIFAILTCFMILSGVLLWQKARDNNNYTLAQRKFHHKTTLIYLAVCLSLFPAITVIFLANKFVPIDLLGREIYVNSIFFGSWLVLIIIGVFKNKYSKINLLFLQIGGFLSILIPITNGFLTEDWIWNTFANNEFYVFSVDVFWLITGITALLIVKFQKVVE
ncbi:hypothetical protein Fleli_3487 [Bernardetia litoralis DSM 6794]|uniref:Iron-regulated membrane protein n=1 Tax=Bernardetia litoralis (strain ATCC 23117 / DSM 6794 / NBRC 15988 / NCIMB 1366 / Fx l1 / Sio-4) TaxID=880071 RepID=I4APC2_BERLS|nr:PepSY-associated TM helix domain-containing protein [Bernardetia litoralis]AFM05807.1 hypothetical protein Fleli_3487 [Bernardetia litoralis DSM 6794]